MINVYSTCYMAASPTPIYIMFCGILTSDSRTQHYSVILHGCTHTDTHHCNLNWHPEAAQRGELWLDVFMGQPTVTKHYVEVCPCFMCTQSRTAHRKRRPACSACTNIGRCAMQDQPYYMMQPRRGASAVIAHVFVAGARGNMPCLLRA